MRLVKVLLVGLAAGALVQAPRSARADTRFGVTVAFGHDGYGYGYAARDTYRLGFDRGYRDGYDHGAKDGRRGENFNFAHDKRFRHADAGYHRHFGPKHLYAQGYRRGYERGYARAYSAYAGPDFDRYGHRYGDRGWYGDRGRYGDRGWYGDRDRDDDRYREPDEDWDRDRR